MEIETMSESGRALIAPVYIFSMFYFGYKMVGGFVYQEIW